MAANAPAVARLLERGALAVQLEQMQVDLAMLERSTLRLRLFQLVVPIALIAAYLMLVPILLLRDKFHTEMLRRKLRKLTPE
jgi:hypothetical protein